MVYGNLKCGRFKHVPGIGILLQVTILCIIVRIKVKITGEGGATVKIMRVVEESR